MLLDDTGDNTHRHTAVFINVGNGKRYIIFLSRRASVKACMGDGVGAVIEADIHNTLMHIGNPACIFALNTALFEIGAVSVFGYTLHICTDGEVFNIITLDLKNSDKNLIPDRKTLVGISNPILGQVSCHNRTLYTKGFNADCLFRNSNDTGLYGTSVIDAIGAGGIFVHIENLTLFQHCFLTAGNNGACLRVNTLNNEVNLAAQHAVTSGMVS